MSHKSRNSKKELQIENKKLEIDVKELKNALDLHHNLNSAQNNTVHGLLRSEIGGSRWQYGGQGKLTSFKSSTDLHDTKGTSPERSPSKMSRPPSASAKTPNRTIEHLEKLKSEIDQQRALLEEKYHLSERIQKDIRINKKQRSKESALNKPSNTKIDSKTNKNLETKGTENLNDSLFDTEYLEIHDKKDKVLEKISAKVIHRNTKVTVNAARTKSPPKKPEIGFGSRIDKKPDKPKPVKKSKIRNFRRAEPATVINDIEKIEEATMVPEKSQTPMTQILDKEIIETQKYLSEPQDEVLGLSQTLIKIKADHDREEENRKLLIEEQMVEGSCPNIIDEQKLSEILLKGGDLNLDLDFTRNSSEFQNDDRQSKSTYENQNNILLEQKSNLQSDIVHDISTSDYSSDMELIPDISTKSAFISKEQEQPAATISLSILKRSVQDSDQISDAFERELEKPLLDDRQVKADKFVKTWLRKLGIEDVQKTALIFAKNNIGMAVMKFVTEEQVCEMGFSSLATMNKILEGIQALKLSSSSSKTLIHSPSPDRTSKTESGEQASLHNVPPNMEKRQSRKANSKQEINSNTAEKPKPVSLRTRSTSRGRQKGEKPDSKQILTRPRSSSRSREIAQRKAEAAVAAAGQKKIEREREMKRKQKEREKKLNKQKQHRDLLAAKHVEREVQKNVVDTELQEPDIFHAEYDDHGSETTGRSTALENYLISSRLLTPESSQRSKPASSTTRTTTREDSDISPERVRSMIKTLLSSDDLQDHMTLNLVKNLQKQLEDVENRIKQKQDDLNSSNSQLSELVVAGENIGTSQQSSTRTPVAEELNSPQPEMHIDDVLRCDSDIGIWDPSKAPNLLSEILPSDFVSKVISPPELETSVTNSQASRPKSNTRSTGGVASMSMSKRALLDEIRKEKDEHRKQIKHLQSELSRLQHKDPVKQSEIPFEDIVFDEKDLLGEGAFSKVYRGYYQATEVAVKKLKVPLNAQDKNYFAAEVSLLRDLRHPRVVLLLGVCTDTKLPLMVLEYMSNGNLFSILHDSTRAPLDHVEFYQISRDIAAGMVYLHNNRPPVLHLDLKSMNVLIGAGNRAKIADFGFSKLKHEADLKAAKNKQIQGSPGWMAPELLLNGEVTVKADVYSFGIILWEMVTRKHPYEGCSMFQILERVRLNERPEFPDHCPPELQRLIQKCWHHNPAKRLVFKEILNMIENLTFPKEWRDLFAEAGIPKLALNDIQSTRNIISLVNSTLESANLQKIVQDYQLFLKEDNAVSSLSSEDLSMDSLEDELEVVTSEDSFEKIIVDTEDGFMGIHNSPIGTSSKSSAKQIEVAHGKKDTPKKIALKVEIPQPSPRKSVTTQQDHLSPHKSTQSQSGRKSREAWSLSEELKLDLPLSPDIPSAPQPQPLNKPIAPPPPPIHNAPAPTKTLSSSKKKSHQKQTSVVNDLKKDFSKRKERKVKSPAASKASSQTRFEVNVSALQEQRKFLRSTKQPHSSQLRDLNGVPQEAISSIAEILKKAMSERRFAIGGVDNSNDVADWSYHSEISP